MKTHNRIPCWIFYWVISFWIVQPLFSQTSSKEVKISGTVVNEQDQIIKGAAILIKKTTTGTASDLSGNFSISVPSLPSVLVVSFVGYDTKEVEVKETTAPIKIQLSQTKIQPSENSKDEPAYQVLDSIDEVPQPVNGREGWHTYIARNIKYSSNDRKAGIQGVVVVAFNISAEGKVQDAEVLRGIGGESDQEAVRVISEAPDWIPGKQNGEPVQTRMRVPILFRMDSDDPKDFEKRINEKAIAEEYGKYFVVVGYSSPSPSK